MYRLHLGKDQITLGEKRADGQLVRGRALSQNSTWEVDRAEREVGEQRGGEVDFPALGVDFDDAADDEVADFGGVARAEGVDGEEFVGDVDGSREGGGYVCASGGGSGG